MRLCEAPGDGFRWPARAPQSQGAFTLIELLVVISIIAMLIAILLPALQSARTAAHKAVSLSNVRQLAIAHYLYAGDNDQTLPYWRRDMASAGGANLPTWAGRLLLDRYYTSAELLHSPARDTSELDYSLTESGTSLRNPTFFPGYGVNRYLFLSEKQVVIEGKNGHANFDMRQMPLLSEVVLMAETWGNEPPYFQYGSRAGYDFVYPEAGRAPSLFTYNGANVRAYFDGHASGGSSRELLWIAETAYEGRWFRPGNEHLEPNTSSQIKSPWFKKWYPE